PDAALRLDALEQRLLAALPPAAQLALDAHVPQPAAPEQPPALDPEPTRWLPVIRRAIKHRRTLAITYTGSADRAPATRHIRPLRLERHGEHWYLHAYCLDRQAERCFRLDRMRTLSLEGGRPRRGDPEARAAARKAQTDEPQA
ncbi:MAG: WYL domain-containing protein, partial [Oscillochloridaceae bacterium umkhey_bin13]